MIPCCCISLLATLGLVRGHTLKRDDDAKLQEEGKRWAAKQKGILHRKKKPSVMENPQETTNSSEEALPSRLEDRN